MEGKKREPADAPDEAMQLGIQEIRTVPLALIPTGKSRGGSPLSPWDASTACTMVGRFAC